MITFYLTIKINDEVYVSRIEEEVVQDINYRGDDMVEELTKILLDGFGQYSSVTKAMSRNDLKQTIRKYVHKAVKDSSFFEKGLPFYRKKKSLLKKCIFYLYDETKKLLRGK